MNPNELRTRFRNMLSTKQRDWYRVVNQAAGPTQIHIYDDIGMSGITARDLVDDLNKINGPVELRLNSGGGEIFDGISIYNALCARDVAIYIDGVAASAASFIAMAASPGKLFIAKTATMMIHDGQAMAMGSAQELTAMVDVLNRESEKIASIYADRTGKDASYFRNKMRAETWYNAQEALDEGLVDAIFDPRTGTTVNKSVTLWNAMGTEESVNGWCWRNGDWVFDPDGDGDDDGTPEGDTDHDYFGPDGKQIKAIPPKPSQPPTKTMDTKMTIVNAEVDNSPWDAAKAWHNGSVAKDPAAFYRAICAAEKTAGDSGTQAHWALPYRYTPDSPPNAAGVRNALARLDQTEGLTDKEAARTKLQGLMKKINPDYDKPGDQTDTSLLSAVLIQALKGGKS
jgi:ATP-dependent protease ClpP protease subunit